MKKILWSLIAVSAILFSCGQGGKTAQAAETKSSAETVIEPVVLNASEFKRLVADYDSNTWNYLGSEPAVIDFYATWCPPCKKLSPILVELATEYDGKVKFYKVDVDKDPAVARAFGVQSMPTLIFIPVDGDPSMAVGYMPKEDLKQIIDDNVF